MNFDLNVLNEGEEKRLTKQQIDAYCLPIKALIQRRDMKLFFYECCDNASMLKVILKPTVENAPLEQYDKFFDTLSTTYKKLEKYTDIDNISLIIPKKDEDRQVLTLRKILDSEEYEEYVRTHPDGLNVVLGETVDNRIIVRSLKELIHILLAGQTGSGKSVALQTMITSLMYLYPPSMLKFALFDMKQVEMSFYRESPYLLEPICTDDDEALKILESLVNEMEKRFALFDAYNVRNIEGYNKLSNVNKMSYIVIVIDEYADLILTKPKCEEYLKRLAQKARACGMHLIIATQRPIVQVVTSVIKGNMPTRIALDTGDAMGSHVILDKSGAEKLNGHGDMIVKYAKETIRLQGAYLSDEELSSIVEETINKYGTNKFCVKKQPLNVEEIPQETYVRKIKEGEKVNDRYVLEDETYNAIMTLYLENRNASRTQVKTVLGSGDRKADVVLEKMVNLNIVGEFKKADKKYPYKMDSEAFSIKFISESEANNLCLQ